MSDRQDSVPGEAEVAPTPETERPAPPIEAAAATIDATVEALKREPAPSEDKKAEPQCDLFTANEAGDVRPAPLIMIAPADSAISGPPPEKSRSGRFALLAATVALAGAIGAMAGTLGATGLSWLKPSVTGTAVAARGSAEDEAIRANLAQVQAELAALKASIENAGRTSGTQFAKIGSRIDRIERSAAEPAAKLAKVIETINRLDRRGAVAAASPGAAVSAPAAAATATATTPAAATATAPAPAPATATPPTTTATVRAAPDITGSIPLPRPKAAQPAVSRETPSATVLNGWRVRDVFDGMALIQGRLGVIEVVPGDILPGLGEIRAVERQHGRWVVVTSRGVITSR